MYLSLHKNVLKLLGYLSGRVRAKSNTKIAYIYDFLSIVNFYISVWLSLVPEGQVCVQMESKVTLVRPLPLPHKVNQFIDFNTNWLTLLMPYYFIIKLNPRLLQNDKN